MTDPDVRQQPLVQERYPQPDLFICDVADATLKDIIPQLEHPFYSFSKKPDTKVRRYEHNGDWVEIVPSVKGLATIYDKDILIYAISQVVAGINRGEEVSKHVRINARALMQFTHRGTSGQEYRALCAALDRLDGTRIRTNVRRGDEEQHRAFGLIESATVARKFGLGGRLLYCEVTLSDWVFERIREEAVLTLDRDYFRLRKPLERRIYELARKHCGEQPSWRVKVDTLHLKSGSRGNIRDFRRMLRVVVEADHLPGYSISFEEGRTDMLVFLNRKKVLQEATAEAPGPQKISSSAIERVKPMVPRGESVYDWEADWIVFWREQGCTPLRNVDKAFIGWCQKRYQWRLENRSHD